MTSLHWCEEDESPRQDPASTHPEQTKEEGDASMVSSMNDRDQVTCKDPDCSSDTGREEEEEGSVVAMVVDKQIKEEIDPSTDGLTEPNQAPDKGDNIE